MKNFIIALFIVSIQLVYAQQKTANRYFEKGDYLNATRYYEKYLKRNQPSKRILLNLSESYFKTFNFHKARFYTSKIINGSFIEKDKSYDNELNFRMYHILSALGNFDIGIDYLASYYKRLNVSFNKEEALNEVTSFRLKTDNFKVRRLALNKHSNDFGAVSYNDTLYFVSDRKKSMIERSYKWTHAPFLDIFKVKLDMGIPVKSTLTALPDHINSKLHEGSFCFSKDGNTLYFSRSNIVAKKQLFSDNKVNTIQLFKVVRENGIWGKPKKLPFCNVNYSYQHPALNNDETLLYLSSNEGKMSSDFDIFKVSVADHKEFGELVNLGGKINTIHREHFPYISKEGHLFFSSNGHLGLGMLDVFISKKTSNGFDKPMNLGAPINSEYDDFGVFYDDNVNGYFSTNRIGSDDIYKFEQTGDVLSVDYLVKVEVRDAETKKLVKASVLLNDNKSKKQVYNNKTKSFALNLKSNSYTIETLADDYMPNSTIFKVASNHGQTKVIYLAKKKPKKVIIKPKKEKVKEVLVDREAVKVKDTITSKIADVKPKAKAIDKVKISENKAIVKSNLLKDKKGPRLISENNELYFDMPPIFFKYNKWTLTDASKKILDELAKKLERHKSVHIKISAHTDSRGSDLYNQMLSEKRAESTRNYLALVGYVNARRIEFEGLGESQPVIDCKSKCTEDEHQANRRSQFKIIKY